MPSSGNISGNNMASKLIAVNVARIIAATGNKLHFSCGSFRQQNRVAAILQEHFYFGKGILPSTIAFRHAYVLFDQFYAEITTFFNQEMFG